MLELREVVKRYRSASEEVLAVDRVSLALGAGEMLALQGPSGSGKSTLLLLAAAALRADGGLVSFQGRDLSCFGERESAQYRLADVGLISQNAHLMARVSALENAVTKLLLGGVALHAARERGLSWLAQVGLAERAGRTPEELSGGERQRVAIARVLAAEPKLILADEPTANLDSERSAEVIELLAAQAHQQGKAVLLVTHDAEAAARADRVLSLRDGRLAEAPAPSSQRA
ncbi:MAG TPA: ATP-binding cassette domain-containing protein [Solirubrobacteraceae bacterium]|jgi:putative ABC transport system ATP-binding protein|nr:ATP-binding cassette domain-containing protein [Solirubrobacteraceae bacterium]